MYYQKSEYKTNPNKISPLTYHCVDLEMLCTNFLSWEIYCAYYMPASILLFIHSIVRKFVCSISRSIRRYAEQDIVSAHTLYLNVANTLQARSMKFHPTALVSRFLPIHYCIWEKLQSYNLNPDTLFMCMCVHLNFFCQHIIAYGKSWYYSI
jgi:hypothetical protein